MHEEQDDHWGRVKRLYSEALEQSENDRLSYIEANTHADKSLRNEVVDLLGIREQADSYFSHVATNLIGEENLIEDIPAKEHISDPYNLIGEVFSHYRILKQLGQGAMGILYQAHDMRLERTVALKLLTPNYSSNTPNVNDQQSRRRMLREARLACSLDHPNVGVIYDIGQTETGHDYIAMGYYEGETLDKLIERQTLTLEQILQIASQIAAGLGAIHEKDVVHCDIKPSNIMIGADYRVIILDFGVAKLRNVDLTDTQARLGTISYMSPEHLRGEDVEATSDIWSLGVVLYEMLAGARPFSGAHPEAVIYSLLHATPKVLPSRLLGQEIPKNLTKVVTACLSHDREKRPQDCKQLAQLLNKFQSGDQSLESINLLRPVLFNWNRLSISSISMLIVAFLVGASISYYTWVATRDSSFGIPVEKHIVVINKKNDSEQTDQLLQGLMASVSRKLKLVERVQDNLWVIPSDEVQSYGEVSLDKIGQTFGVNLILLLEATVDGENINLSMQLLNATDQTELDRKMLSYPREQLPLLAEDLVGASFELLKFDKALVKRRKLVNKNTKSPKAYANFLKGLGLIQRPDNVDNVNAAIDAFKLAIEIDAQYANAYANLGEAYWHRYHESMDLDYLEQASQNLEKSLTLDSNLYSAYNTLGIVNTARGKYGSAKAAFQLMLADKEDSVDAIIGLAKVNEATNQLEQAEGYYLQAIALQPENWSVHNDLGIFYATHGRAKEALVSFDRTIELTPLNARAFSNLANTYWFLGDFEKAKNTYSRSLDIRPSYSAYANLGANLYTLHDFENAAKMFENALKLEEKDFRIWGFFANAAHFAGYADETFKYALNRAISGAERDIKIHPSDETTISYLAFYYALLGNKAPSLSLLAGLSIQDKHVPGVFYAVGEVYEMLGDRNEALKWLEHALQFEHLTLEITNNPWLADLREDDAYSRLLERITAKKNI